MATNSITIEPVKFKEAVQALKVGQSEAPRALAAALNRTMTFVRSQIVKSVRARYVIPAADVRSSIKDEKKASISRLAASLKIRGSTLTVYSHFKVTPKLRPMGKGKKYKINVTIIKGARKALKGRAFLPSMTSTKQKSQIWIRRAGAKRKPIVPLHTLSVAQMVNDEIAENIQKQASEMLDKRVEHELEYALEKAANKYGL